MILKKNILFVYRINKANPSNQGVLNKLEGQLKACQNYFTEVSYINHDDHHIYLSGKQICEIPSGTESLMFKWHFYSLLQKSLDFKTYDVIYIRFGLFTLPMFQCLKHIKFVNPECKLILEYPTYPYQSEWTGIFGKTALLMNHLFRPSVLKLVDLSVFYGDEPTTYTHRHLKLTNGIDVSSIKIKEQFHPLGSLNLIAVGRWEFWHGLDRLIVGISDYTIQNPQLQIQLSIIGTGPVLPSYRKLVKNLNLTRYISFHGNLDGKELDDQFENAHVAVGSLGVHRKKLFADSSLKHREYCARGIPFVMSSHDLDFEDTSPFVLHLPQNDDPINLSNLCTFYQKLNPTQYLSQKMRSYALCQLSWDDRIEKIMAQLE